MLRSKHLRVGQSAAYGDQGIFISCRMGKEKQCVAEVMNLFHSLSDELWPPVKSVEEPGLDIEEIICRELGQLRLPSREQRFQSVQTNTPCRVIYVICTKPVDPVKLILSHMHQAAKTHICRTRYVERFAPVSRVCYASLADLSSMAEDYLPSAFREFATKPIKYKIEIKLRNHNVVERQSAIDEVLKFVPPQHHIDLEQPEVVVLLEIFKNICGISLLPQYYDYHRYSPSRVAQTRRLAPLK